eukprot:g67655.t1
MAVVCVRRSTAAHLLQAQATFGAANSLWVRHKHARPRVKVILTEDVPNLGFQGEEVQVKRGRARLDLVPSKQAVWATEENKKLFLKTGGDQVAEDTAEEKWRAFVQDLRHQVKYCGLHFWRQPVGETGNEFLDPPVTARKIWSHLVEKKQFEWLLPSAVIVDETIRTFGHHSATVDISYWRAIGGEVKNEATRSLPGMEKSEEQREWEETPWTVKMNFTIKRTGVTPFRKRKGVRASKQLS